MSAGGAEAGARVMVFARAPRPGHCKTRLAPALGAAGAAELHRRLVRHTLVTALAARLGAVELWCAPDATDPFFEQCRDEFGVSLATQPEGDLGERMAAAFAAAAVGGAPFALLVGSDAPALGAAELRRAGHALAQGHDAAIVPAEDGGYVLLGLSHPEPAIFSDMPWGGERVLAQTLARLRGLGRRVVLLPACWDVDRPEDLARLRRCPPASGLAGLLDGLAA